MTAHPQRPGPALGKRHFYEDVERITRHELKGPLAGIIGLLQKLASACTRQPQHDELRQLLEERSLQLLQMLHRLLHTSGAACAEKALQADLHLPPSASGPLALRERATTHQLQLAFGVSATTVLKW